MGYANEKVGKAIKETNKERVRGKGKLGEMKSVEGKKRI